MSIATTPSISPSASASGGVSSGSVDIVERGSNTSTAVNANADAANVAVNAGSDLGVDFDVDATFLPAVIAASKATTNNNNNINNANIANTNGNAQSARGGRKQAW